MSIDAGRTVETRARSRRRKVRLEPKKTTLPRWLTPEILIFAASIVTLMLGTMLFGGV